MDKKSVFDEIVVMLESKYCVKDIGDKNTSLLDPQIGLMPRDLFTLFFDLQTKYNIKFIESDVMDKRFDCIGILVEIVYQKIKENNNK